MRRAWLLLLVLMVTNLVTALSAANVVPDSKAGQQTQVIDANALKPADCASLNLTAVVVGSTGTAASELILGDATVNTMTGGAGDDCILGGAGNDSLDGGTGTDVCIGGADNDTYTGGEATVDTAPVCSAPGPQTVMANRDTYVDNFRGTTNYGTVANLDVRPDSGFRRRRTLVGFALPAVPAGCSVTVATLRLNATSVAGARTVEAYRAAAAWAETTVTWNTQPGATGPAATRLVTLGTNDWTVTSQVQALYAGPNNGFHLQTFNETTGADLQQFSSRETLGDPQLIITFG